jgi:peroxiredoxin
MPKKPYFYKKIQTMRVLPAIVLAISLFACAKEGEIKVSGQYEGDIADGMVFIELIKDDTKTTVDSFYLDQDGKFERTLMVDEPAFYRINFNNRAIVNAILNDTDVQLVANPEISGAGYEVKGSVDTDYIQTLATVKSTFDQEVQSLNGEFMKARSQGDVPTMDALRNQYVALEAELTRSLKSEIWKMDNSIAGILAVTYFEDPEAEFEFLDSLASKYQQQLPNSSYAQELIDRVETMRMLAVGSPAPEINLPDPTGNNISLSSLKGSYVLIDFWAAWCRPCRMENPNVVRMYNTYHDQGFEILGVSLDRKKDDWIKAIEKDQLTWQHVSDLKYFQSEAAKDYQINAIPATYLIGPDGVIIAKNLRGPTLEAKLKEIFG